MPGAPRSLILVSGSGAVLLGLGYLFLAGAPFRLGIMNLAALALGLVLILIGKHLPAPRGRTRGILLCLAAASLVATALFGTRVEGASRWVVIGGLAVQPSLILVPPLLLAHALRPSRTSSLAVALAALAMATQPDRSVAGMIAAAALLLWVQRRGHADLLLALASAAFFAATLLRPDRLPAIPHVDQLLWTAFAAHPLAGMAVWAGSALLLLPAAALARRGELAAALVFAAMWGGAILAAALGNYPTPLVGYGASAILGYLLTALPLGRGAAEAAAGVQAPDPATQPGDSSTQAGLSSLSHAQKAKQPAISASAART